MKSTESKKSCRSIGGLSVSVMAALVLLGAFCGRAGENAGPQFRRQQGQPLQNRANANNRVRKKLNDFVITMVKFEDVPVSQAFRNLEQLSRRMDPEEIGVKITLRVKDAVAEKTLSMKIENVRMGTAIAYICQQANLIYRIEADGVVILPGVPGKKNNRP